MPDKDARRCALAVLQRVIQQGESLSTALPVSLADVSQPQDRAFVQMLVYGVLRNYWRLEALLRPLVKKPFKSKDSDIQLILLLALHQLTDTRVPDYASVNAAVSLVPRKKAWARGLVNAVLRNFIRQQEVLQNKIESDEQAHYAHPQWIINKLRHDWPNRWQSILQSNNQQAPITLRINQQQINIDDYCSQLDLLWHRQGEAVVLEQAVDVTQLPGYQQGWFSVQDAGAQRAAPLLDLQPGQRVLDACAAPGGKSCHMLELQPAIELVAMDVSEVRLQRVAENLQRLQLKAELVTGDAVRPDEWWDGKPFDRILLDVPCSASGVIRRHPDIKLLRRQDDIEQLIAVQQDIVQKIWPLLSPGGLLLYVTCSVFQDENENQVNALMAEHRPRILQ